METFEWKSHLFKYELKKKKKFQPRPGGKIQLILIWHKFFFFAALLISISFLSCHLSRLFFSSPSLASLPPPKKNSHVFRNHSGRWKKGIVRNANLGKNFNNYNLCLKGFFLLLVFLHNNVSYDDFSNQVLYHTVLVWGDCWEHVFQNEKCN